VSDLPPERALDSAAIHALSNHLAVILGFVDLVLSETTADDPRSDDLRDIREAAMAASRLIGRPVGEQ
jgi:hypothetical protein